ncbi:MAG: two component transcriptional regulator, LuxR family [Thermoleophilia bacterium]|nr:two component transcriptional regulator, LuxR family [Thermoleophilia bacterium]
MPSAGPATDTPFTSSLVSPPYEGIVVVHSSHVARMGIEELFANQPCGLRVVGSHASVEEAGDVLSAGRPVVAIVESQIEPGGALAQVARGVREGRRVPVVALLGTDEQATVPVGFCQAAVRMGGTSHQLIDAVTAVRDGGTHLGAGLRTQVAADGCDPDEPLTPRELEMLREIAYGGTSKQLAVTHMVSYETVKTHVASALRKLGASTRAHAVAIGYERGLLGDNPPLVIKSSIAWTRLAEVTVFETFAEAAGDVLRYLYDLCGFDTWLLTETIDDHCVSLESLGSLPPAVMKVSENLCSIMSVDSGVVAIDDVRAGDIDAEARRLFTRLEVRSYLSVPIARSSDGSIHAGLCAFSSTPRPEGLRPDQISAVNDCAELLSSMVPAATE